MAKASNAFTQGLSGKISGIVFRRGKNGNIIAANAPQPASGTPSTEQKRTRDNFSNAANYAREAVKDPGLKAEYEARIDDNTPSAYAAAMQDALIKPVIQHVDFSGYKGKVGDKIRIVATDNHAVQRVSVRIENPDGSLIEEGNAVRQGTSYEWLFTATAANAALPGDTITVTAYDRPGNAGTAEQTL